MRWKGGLLACCDDVLCLLSRRMHAYVVCCTSACMSPFLVWRWLSVVYMYDVRIYTKYRIKAIGARCDLALMHLQQTVLLLQLTRKAHQGATSCREYVRMQRCSRIPVFNGPEQYYKYKCDITSTYRRIRSFLDLDNHTIGQQLSYTR